MSKKGSGEGGGGAGEPFFPERHVSFDSVHTASSARSGSREGKGLLNQHRYVQKNREGRRQRRLDLDGGAPAQRLPPAPPPPSGASSARVGACKYYVIQFWPFPPPPSLFVIARNFRKNTPPPTLGYVNFFNISVFLQMGDPTTL